MLAGIWLRNAERLRRPHGLHDGEITDIRIVKSIQQGDLRVFYPSDTGGGRESLYHGVVAPLQIFFQHPTLGYQIFSIWSATLAMALLYLSVKRLYGNTAAIFAVAFWSLSFVPVLLSRNIGRESLLAIPVLLTLLLLTNRKEESGFSLQGAQHTRFAFFLLSVTLGFSLYLHPSAVGLALGCLLYLLINYRRNLAYLRINWPYLLFALILLTIIALPKAISTIQHPHLAGVVRWLPTQEDSQRVVVDFSGIYTNASGFLLHGDKDVTINIPGRPLLDPLSALLIVVGTLFLIRRWRETSSQILLLFSVVLAIPGLITTNGPDFLAYAPLMPVLSIYWGIGVRVGWRWLTIRGLPVIIGHASLAILLLGLFLTTRQNLLEVWPTAVGQNEAYHRNLQVFANYLNKSANEIPTVFCGIPSISAPKRLNDADILQLMLREKNLPIRFVDCFQGLVLASGGERQQYVFADLNVLETSPEWFRKWLDESGEYQLIGSDLDFPLSKQVIQFDVSEPLATTLGGFTTTRPLRFPRAQERPVAPAIRYGGNLTFLGYDFLSEAPYAPGEAIPIDLFWRVDGSVPKDIHIYLHLVFHESDLANIIAQVDTVSALPESLEARDIWVHRVELDLPESIPAGDYLLLLGAYSKQSGDRMPVYDKGEGSHILGDYLILPDIPVVAADNPDE